MKKLFVLMFVLFAATSLLYSQDAVFTAVEEPTVSTSEKNHWNSFLNYMKGRNKVSLDFTPNIGIYGLPAAANFAADHLGINMGDFIGDTIISTVDSIGFEGANVQGFDKIKTPQPSFGMRFGYEFNVLPYLSVVFDADFVIGGFELSGQISGVNQQVVSDRTIDIDLAADFSGGLYYKIVTHSVGAKFFPKQNAPYGFYIMPKLGVTYVNVRAKADLKASISAANNEAIDQLLDEYGITREELSNEYGVDLDNLDLAGLLEIYNQQMGSSSDNSSDLGSLPDIDGFDDSYYLGDSSDEDSMLSMDSLSSLSDGFGLEATGVFASVELGWNVQLFPNMTKDWPVHFGLDIALFDIGYYFVPWAKEVLELDMISEMGFSSYAWAANMRFAFLPKVAFTVKF